MKKSYKIVVIFSLVVFIIILITMALVAFSVGSLYHWGLLREPDPGIFFLVLAIVSVVVSTIIAFLVSKKVTSPVTEISNATKEVAKGNFNIVLNEQGRAQEVNEMAHNFNVMTAELANTETFRDDFIDNVSHEFKTPLAAIEGYSVLLQNKSLDEEKREFYIEKIIYNTQRLSYLTGSILQISRLENQEITSQKEEFSLDEQLRETILVFEKQWNEKRLTLNVDLDKVDYVGNKELLAQVWQNIFGNAVKYTSEENTIDVILKTDDDFAVVTISDNGPGMSNEVRERVFEKFYQGEDSHSEAGNGLGLTLAKRIVDLCGGTIEVWSREGQGTTFAVKLPF